jgi:hypothetical protein
VVPYPLHHWQAGFGGGIQEGRFADTGVIEVPIGPQHSDSDIGQTLLQVGA